jgi:predicted nucleotide-binding protein
MEPIKPLIFAGGSKEKSQLLVCLTDELKELANVHPWWASDAFHPLGGTLEGLLSATKKYDFAIFIITPDDFIKSRETKSFTARDNVLFEFGFIPRHSGCQKDFGICTRQPDHKVEGTERPVLRHHSSF